MNLKNVLHPVFSAVVCLILSATIGMAEPLVLNWDKAWELALKHNESMAAAKDQINIADHQIGEAYASAMPTVAANGVFQHYFKIPQSIMIMPPAFSESGQEFRVKIKQGSENTAIGDVTLTQPLWLAGKIGIAVKLAKIYGKISRFGLEVSKEELRKSLIETYYGVLLGEEYLRVSHEALAQAERHHQQVQNLFDQGMVSEYDLIRARVAVANLRPQTIDAETGLDMAIKGLKLLIGLDVDQEIVLEGTLDQAVAKPLEYDVSVQQALEKRSEFQQLGLQAQLYDGQYEVERRNWLWPNVLVNAKYSTMASAEDWKLGKYEFLDGLSGSLVIQIPLFDGFVSKHKSQTALINKRAVLRQKTLFEKSVKVQIADALNRFRSAESKHNAALETLEQAEKGNRIAEVRYREGVGTQLELLDAQLQLNSSKVNVLQAQYDLLTTRAAYDRAIGEGRVMRNGKGK